MDLIDLAILYVLAGALCAVVVWRRQRGSRSALRVGSSALLALLLWPLWAPFALMDSSAEAPPPAKAKPARPTPTTPRAQRLEEQLRLAVAAAEGTGFEEMLGAAAAERMRTELRQATARLAELEALLQQPNFDAAAAHIRVDALVAEAARDASVLGQLRSARLHLGNVERLTRLRVAQARALDELEQALAALHSQLVLAHYAGSGAADVGAIVNDLWSRVEGLGEVLEGDEHAEDADVVVLNVVAQEAC